MAVLNDKCYVQVWPNECQTKVPRKNVNQPVASVLINILINPANLGGLPNAIA